MGQQEGGKVLVVCLAGEGQRTKSRVIRRIHVNIWIAKKKTGKERIAQPAGPVEGGAAKKAEIKVLGPISWNVSTSAPLPPDDARNQSADSWIGSDSRKVLYSSFVRMEGVDTRCFRISSPSGLGREWSSSNLCSSKATASVLSFPFFSFGCPLP